MYDTEPPRRARRGGSRVYVRAIWPYRGQRRDNTIVSANRYRGQGCDNTEDKTGVSQGHDNTNN